MEHGNNSKKSKKNSKSSKSQFNETNISDMMREVNAMLQKNPEMVKKVSKCVNNIFENDTLMNKLVSEINTGIILESDSDSNSSDSGDNSDIEVEKVVNDDSTKKKNSKTNKTNKTNKNNNKKLGPVENID
jgi:hypothetical protein